MINYLLSRSIIASTFHMCWSFIFGCWPTSDYLNFLQFLVCDRFTKDDYDDYLHPGHSQSIFCWYDSNVTSLTLCSVDNLVLPDQRGTFVQLRRMIVKCTFSQVYLVSYSSSYSYREAACTRAVSCHTWVIALAATSPTHHHPGKVIIRDRRNVAKSSCLQTCC